LGINQSGASKSMEKLSSGFRINRAGDDAAGLAISEKMRGQIRGLKQATRNAQDGISLIQTAEGALNETHAILQRMRELAVQASTDTNTPADRAEIQKEIDQLATEITRISTDTEFNTQKLLDGEFGSIFHIGANQGQNVDLGINDMGANALSVEGVVSEAKEIDEITGASVRSRTGETVTVTFVASEDDDNEAVTSTTAKINEDGSVTVTLAQAAGDGDAAGDVTATNADVLKALQTAGLIVETDDTYISEVATAKTTLVNDSEIVIQFDEADAKASKEYGINVSSQAAADKAITTINNALENVSGERSKLGAMQNRLEHTIANLGTSAENLQAAEARIRDLDMAEEIMAFTKNNILQQAATAMLAQANMAPQSVLQLLG
jgi:flagellin